MNSSKKLLIASCAFVLVAGGVACNRDEDQVRYETVPKEQQQQPAEASNPAPDATGQQEEIAWTVPAGWARKPGAAEGMRYATFEAGDGVELTVVPLGGEAGTVLANVNRWENQLGLPASSEADLGKVTKDVQTTAGPALVVDLTGPASGAKPATRMLAAMVKHGETTWFYKLSGPAAVVEKQVENFNAFTKSTRFAPGQAQASLPPAAPANESAGGSGFTYAAPAGWEKEGPKPMREVSFVVDGKGEVIVTRLPEGVGDPVSNLNRWRGQVGLGPVEEAGKAGQEVTVGGAKGTMYDFAGAERRQIVVVVNREGSDWYIKVIGPKDIVEKERGAFTKFLESVKWGG